MNNEKHYYAQNNNFTTEVNAVPLGLIDTIQCGDAIEMIKTIPDNSIDCVITSPPYNFDMEYSNYDDSSQWLIYFDWLDRVWDEAIRILKWGGRLIINVMPSFSHYVPTHHIISASLMKKKMIWRNEIIWDKSHHGCKATTWGSWRSPSSPYIQTTWEYILVFSKGNIKHIGNANDADISADEFKSWIGGMWKLPGSSQGKKYNHPAMMSDKVAERLIKLFTFRHDLILDMFNGVGTTTSNALFFDRHFIGIDISQEYCDTALTRNIKIMEADYFLGQE